MPHLLGVEGASQQHCVTLENSKRERKTLGNSAVAHDKMEVRLQVGGGGGGAATAACVAKRVDLLECFDTLQ